MLCAIIIIVIVLTFALLWVGKLLLAVGVCPASLLVWLANVSAWLCQCVWSEGFCAINFAVILLLFCVPTNTVV